MQHVKLIKLWIKGLNINPRENTNQKRFFSQQVKLQKSSNVALTTRCQKFFFNFLKLIF